MNTYGIPNLNFFDYTTSTQSQFRDNFSYKPSLYPSISSDFSQANEMINQTTALSPTEMSNDFLYTLENDNAAKSSKESTSVQPAPVVNTVPSNVNYNSQYWSSNSLDSINTPSFNSFNTYSNMMTYDYNPTLTYFYQDYRNNTLTRGLPRGRAVLDEHPSIRPFRCDFPKCGKMFKRSEHLKRHSRSIHSFYRPHLCDYPGCGKSFSRTDNLAQHKRIHQNKNRQSSLSISTGSVGYQKFNDTNMISPILSPLNFAPHSVLHSNQSFLNHNIKKPYSS